jgi:hypothetical protein
VKKRIVGHPACDRLRVDLDCRTIEVCVTTDDDRGLTTADTETHVILRTASEPQIAADKERSGRTPNQNSLDVQGAANVTRRLQGGASRDLHMSGEITAQRERACADQRQTLEAVDTGELQSPGSLLDNRSFAKERADEGRVRALIEHQRSINEQPAPQASCIPYQRAFDDPCSARIRIRPRQNERAGSGLDQRAGTRHYALVRSSHSLVENHCGVVLDAP